MFFTKKVELEVDLPPSRLNKSLRANLFTKLSVQIEGKPYRSYGICICLCDFEFPIGQADQAADIVRYKQAERQALNEQDPALNNYSLNPSILSRSYGEITPGKVDIGFKVSATCLFADFFAHEFVDAKVISVNKSGIFAEVANLLRIFIKKETMFINTRDYECTFNQRSQPYPSYTISRVNKQQHKPAAAPEHFEAPLLNESALLKADPLDFDMDADEDSITITMHDTIRVMLLSKPTQSAADTFSYLLTSIGRIYV